MPSGKEQYRSAKEIYERGYGNEPAYPGYQGRPDARGFFTQLRDAVIRELEGQGFCPFLDMLIEARPSKLDPVVLSVVSELGEYYAGASLTDVSQETYLPHLTVCFNLFSDQPQRIAWSECRGLGRNRYLVGEPDHRKMELARARGREIHRKQLEQERVRRQEQERESVLQERDRILEKARGQAEEILREAQEEAATFGRQRRMELEQRSQEAADRLVERYLAERQRAYRDECEQTALLQSAQSEAAMEELDRIHDEMCGRTDALQANWVREVEEVAGRLERMKAELYRHLHEWQVSLYPHELRPLAERYLELYRIVNVDRLIRAELLAEDEDADAGASRQETVQGLQKLAGTLNTFLAKFARSLGGLGMYVFIPQPGEPFDEIWHLCEDDGEDAEGKRIVRCMIPGVARKTRDGGEDDVIVPATVSVG